MSGERGTSGVRRLVFVMFAATGLVLIVAALVLLIMGPASRWPIAVLGVICAAALEVSWIRVGSVPHRTVVISLPILALPALAPALSPEIALGLVVLGVLLVILVHARRPSVALYSAGLAGAGGVASLALFATVRAAGLPELLAVAVAGAGYVVVVVVLETLRMRFTKDTLDLGGRRKLSLLRVLGALLACAGISVVAALWSAKGLPLRDGHSAFLNATIVLIVLMVVAAMDKLLTRVVMMRRRLDGLIAGASSLTTANRFAKSPRGVLPGELSHTDPATDVAEALCKTVADTIGVESVVVRTEPPGPGELGVPVGLAAGLGQYVVARRDVMDGAFTIDDRSALGALAHTANLVVKARHNIGGLAARANTDHLTGLPNYGAFQESLANINDKRKYSEALAVLFIDLDDFKRMNDRYGHQAGDDILRELGARLSLVVRPHDVVARVGGDEFVIILTELSSLAEAKGIAERIMVASGRPLDIDGNSISPVLSIGLAYSAHRETDLSQLVQDADRSMLVVKKSRRRGGRSTQSSIGVSDHRASEMNDIVIRAIDEELLQVAYQPIVSLVTGRIWAFEALVRYTDPVLGPIPPPTLVETAKELGRLDMMTRQVGLAAMAAAAEFRRIEPGIVCMAINVEAGQILPDRVGSFVTDLVERYPGISLCLELNERSTARVSAAVRTQAERLRDLGVMIALDDYGSQDSSVDALVRVPMDILKIDKSLVDDLDDIRQREVLTALQNFGDNLEYSMIVEGIENEKMVAHIDALGVRSAQGFYYGFPLSLEQTLARLGEFGATAVLPPGTTGANGAPLTTRAAMALP